MPKPADFPTISISDEKPEAEVNINKSRPLLEYIKSLTPAEITAALADTTTKQSIIEKIETLVDWQRWLLTLSPEQLTVWMRAVGLTLYEKLIVVRNAAKQIDQEKTKRHFTQFCLLLPTTEHRLHWPKEKHQIIGAILDKELPLLKSTLLKKEQAIIEDSRLLLATVKTTSPEEIAEFLSDPATQTNVTASINTLFEWREWLFQLSNDQLHVWMHAVGSRLYEKLVVPGQNEEKQEAAQIDLEEKTIANAKQFWSSLPSKEYPHWSTAWCKTKIKIICEALSQELFIYIQFLLRKKQAAPSFLATHVDIVLDVIKAHEINSAEDLCALLDVFPNQHHSVLAVVQGKWSRLNYTPQSFYNLLTRLNTEKCRIVCINLGGKLASIVGSIEHLTNLLNQLPSEKFKLVLEQIPYWLLSYENLHTVLNSLPEKKCLNLCAELLDMPSFSIPDDLQKFDALPATKFALMANVIKRGQAQLIDSPKKLYDLVISLKEGEDEHEFCSVCDRLAPELPKIIQSAQHLVDLFIRPSHNLPELTATKLNSLLNAMQGKWTELVYTPYSLFDLLTHLSTDQFKKASQELAPLIVNDKDLLAASASLKNKYKDIMAKNCLKHIVANYLKNRRRYCNPDDEPDKIVHYQKNYWVLSIFGCFLGNRFRKSYAQKKEAVACLTHLLIEPIEQEPYTPFVLEIHHNASDVWQTLRNGKLGQELAAFEKKFAINIETMITDKATIHSDRPQDLIGSPPIPYT